MLSNTNLFKICLFGAVATAGSGICLELWIQHRFRKSLCFQEAVQYLSATNKAVEYLGQPIRFGLIEADIEPDAINASFCRFKVPLHGSKSTGTLYYAAVREDKWYLSEVQLELEKIPDKKFLLKERKNDTIENEPI